MGVVAAGAKYLYANEDFWAFMLHHAAICTDHVNATLYQLLY